jgi:hypothetical protein
MTEAPTQQDEVEEIVADARRERMLVPQALLALAVVVVIVVVREILFR